MSQGRDGIIVDEKIVHSFADTTGLDARGWNKLHSCKVTPAETIAVQTQQNTTWTPKTKCKELDI
jgi:hypothetical protein